MFCRPLVLLVHIQFLPILFSACIIARRTTTILNSPIRLHLYSSLFYTVVPIFAPFWSSRRSSVYIPNSVTNQVDTGFTTLPVIRFILHNRTRTMTQIDIICPI